MSVTRSIITAALAALLLAPLAAQTRPGPPAAAPAISVEWIYLPGPPEVVAGATVTSAKWSPDGQYALAVREKATMLSLEDIRMEPSIVLWNAGRKTSTVVWRVESSDYHIHDVTWLPGTSVAYAMVRVERPDGLANTVWRIDARRATATEVPGIGPEDGLSVSPRLPFAVVNGQDEEGGYLRTLDATGKLGPAVRSEAVSPIPLGWSSDGAAVHLPQALNGERGTGTWWFRPGTGEIVSSQEPPAYAQPVAPALPFRVEVVEIKLVVSPAAGGTARLSPEFEGEKVRTLRLVQGDGASAESMLVAVDAREWSVSPRGDAILYTCREGCFVVPLVRINQAEAERARAAARRVMLMNNGKQVAIGVIMYAADNDDMLPAAGSDLRNMLAPYTRSSDVFNGLSGPSDGFVYTFEGGPITQVADPANTEMGYIPAPGGRVVVYIDGHVQFHEAGAASP